MAKSRPIDRRLYKRVPVTTKLSFRFLETSADLRKFEGKTTDISGGGIFIRSESLPAAGTLVELQLVVPQRPQGLRVLGKVVWVEEKAQERGFAVEFYKMNTQDRNDVLLCSRRGSWMSPPQGA